jgi:hypothetical protein
MPLEVVEDGGWEEEEAITCGVDMRAWVSYRDYIVIRRGDPLKREREGRPLRVTDVTCHPSVFLFFLLPGHRHFSSVETAGVLNSTAIHGVA